MVCKIRSELNLETSKAIKIWYKKIIKGKKCTAITINKNNNIVIIKKLIIISIYSFCIV